MDGRIGILFIVLLGAGWGCTARFVVYHISTERSANHGTVGSVMHENEGQYAGEVIKNNQVCTLCEEFATQALDYLANNKTENEVLEILRATCSRVLTFKEKCITLVDYYAPLFFSEISSLQPEAFCRKVNLCQEMVTLSSQLKEDSCALCHTTVSNILVKLKDPDTQLDILEVLLKACNSMDKYAQKCKRLVFEYGPLFLASAEKFLEQTDICCMLHACNPAAVL